MLDIFACVRQAIMVQTVRLTSMNVHCINHAMRMERGSVNMVTTITPAFVTLATQVNEVHEGGLFTWDGLARLQPFAFKHRSTANIFSRLFTFETARLPFQTARSPLEM